MAKYTDKTIEEWEDIVEEWHNSPQIEQSLPEYMDLNEIEYLKFVHNITDDTLSDEEVREKATQCTREAVVGLTLLEIFA